MEMDLRGFYAPFSLPGAIYYQKATGSERTVAWTATNSKKSVRAHQAGVYRYVRYLGASESDTEDVLQDTFIVLPRKITGLNSVRKCPLAAWLRSIAQNTFLTRCRREQRRKLVQDVALVNAAKAVCRQGDGREGRAARFHSHRDETM